MAYFFCPATGHVPDRAVDGGGPLSFCPDHGVPPFRDCRACGSQWPLATSGSYGGKLSAGALFCKSCGTPGPWLSRTQLIRWLQYQVQTSDLPATTRLALRTALDCLKGMNADDPKTVAGWKLLQEHAPKVWATTKLVRAPLIGEAVTKALGLEA